MKKYKINIFNSPVPKIETIEVERETKKSVWIDGNRYSKIGSFCYYDTWKEAHAKLEEIAIARIMETEKELKNRYKRLKEIREIK